MSLGIGKRRCLTACSTMQGVFAILALDQRGSLRKAINPEDPEGVTYETLVKFKQHVISRLAPETSAVLLDPEYGTAQNILADTIPGSVGHIVALEETGYAGEPYARMSEILQGWSVEKAQKLGASGVKMLVYYHPESDLAEQQRELILEVAETCRVHDLAFFLEPIVHGIDPENPKLSPDERRETIIETARILSQTGADILKVEFPVDVNAQPDQAVWYEACQELTEACAIPWVLLSAGVDYPLYLKQVVTACSAGASGIMVGRAVWKEAVGLSVDARERFLRETAIERFIKLRSVVDGLAMPWKTYYPESTVPEFWYQSY